MPNVIQIASLKKIGERIQSRRNEKDLSLADVGKVAGVGAGALLRWETAEREGGIRSMCLAAAALGMTPNDAFLEDPVDATGLDSDEQRDFERIRRTAVALHNASGGRVRPLNIVRAMMDEIADQLALTIPIGTEIKNDGGIRTYTPPRKGSSQAKGTAEGEQSYGKRKRKPSGL